MGILEAIKSRRLKADKIVCNMCGRSSKKNKFGYFEEFAEFRQKWGYHSEFDGEEHCFEICPECYKELTDKFAVQIKSTYYGE